MIAGMPILMWAALMASRGDSRIVPAAATPDSEVCIRITHWFPERRSSIRCLSATRYRRLQDQARADAAAERRRVQERARLRRLREAEARRALYERELAERRYQDRLREQRPAD
jgi:hypothetical protein